jgi:serine/threonine protein kinase
MATRRIGDRELGQAATKQSGRVSRTARFSAAIASPLGVLTILPLLVAAVGLFLTVVGQRALQDSNLTMARDRIDEETALVARGIGVALEQSDPILDRLGTLARQHDPSQPYAPVAHALLDLMVGHAGVSYVSISFPDGTFQGVYRDTEDSQILAQDSRVTPEGTIVKRFLLVGHDALQPYREERSDYDPRNRSFYALALATHGRAWTKPYPFFRTHLTGITRTEAIRFNTARGRPELHAVITVDFDVAALSAILSRISLGGATTLLYADDGTVLAYPRGEAAIERLPLRSDRALLYGDLDDPLLSAFFGQFAGGDLGQSGGLGQLEVNGAALVVAHRPIAGGADLPWSVAALMPEAQVLGALHRHQQRSLLAAALATLLATGVAWLFARHILRTRHEIAAARAEIAKAVLQVQELGSYRLVERLGKGGMGEVWRAEHRLLVRQAAIKLISVETSSALDLRDVQERFRREAQCLATLRSRNTIELFDYGVTAEGTFFYVMELLDGMDLETLVDKFGAQPAARVIHFLIQACNSLAEAHDAGLVHRDIKPANLYVCRVADEVDVIKVLDFGLVRAALRGPDQQGQNAPSAGAIEAPVSAQTDEARLTQMGQAMGTPAYMAPEQALGHESDGRADLYALGCVGYWLLTGRLLFERSTSLATMMAHITEPPPQIEHVVTGYLPPELATLLRFCLSKQPADRPSDARAFARALKAIPIPPAEQWTEARAQAWWRQRTSRAAAPARQDELGIA